MTLTLHRVAKWKYAQEPVLLEHGYGAAHYGSRWNSFDEALRWDRRIIFASDTLAQAMLEVLVHVEAEVLYSVPHGHVRFEVEEDEIAALDLTRLPPRWNAHPPTSASQVIGDQWYDEAVSPVLRVPSAILPLEAYDEKHGNYLIHARHPRILEAVRLLGVAPLPMDPRLK